MSVEVVLLVLAMLPLVVVLQVLPSRVPRWGPIFEKDVLRGRGPGEAETEGDCLSERLGELAGYDMERMGVAVLA